MDRRDSVDSKTSKNIKTARLSCLEHKKCHQLCRKYRVLDNVDVRMIINVFYAPKCIKQDWR